MSVDLENDQFQSLLTDALRAGPGSPEWHKAVATLRSAGADTPGLDEYQMLIRAREDLESGKGYRAVKAGPGFTRKVLTAIEEEGGGKEGGEKRGIPSANIIAMVAAGAVLAVIVVVAVILSGNTPEPQNKDLDALRGLYFVKPSAAIDFEALPAAGAFDPGSAWRLVGEVPLKFSTKALRPGATQPSAGVGREYRAGALEKTESIPAEQAAMLDVTFKLAGKLTDAVVPQVFISEGPIDQTQGTGVREFIWLFKGGQAQVLRPDGSVPGQGEKLKPSGPQTLNVKMRFNRDSVIVETDGKKVYEGALMLSATAPRYVGVRFLRKAGDNAEGAVLSSVTITRP